MFYQQMKRISRSLNLVKPILAVLARFTGMAWAFARHSSDYVAQGRAAIGAALGVHKHD